MSRVTRTMNQQVTLVHRYFFEESTKTYFGYDVVLRPDPQGNGYLLNFYDLSIGPLDFNVLTQDFLDPTQWHKAPMPPLPAARVMKPDDTVEITAYLDQQSGRKVTDTMSLLRQAYRISVGNVINTATQNIPLRVLMPMNRTTTAPYINGEAREFSVDDAELRIQAPRVTINGQAQQFGNLGHAASGSLIWFYVPGHGRYILSLSPRPALGFVKAGDLRGGTVKFTADKDEVLVETPVAVAPGDAPYVLYVLHDADWTPTAQAQRGTMLVGSVSARELAALK